MVKLVSFFLPVLVSKLFNFDRKCFVMHKFVNHDLESTEADKMIVACTWLWGRRLEKENIAVTTAAFSSH